ncbi:hypothetical protein LI177_06380, partial [bacterium 210820-DFI.6.37]|nr:hypothetical protein [bacterium 210820-DFI.6.37]
QRRERSERRYPHQERDTERVSFFICLKGEKNLHESYRSAKGGSDPLPILRGFSRRAKWDSEESEANGGIRTKKETPKRCLFSYI